MDTIINIVNFVKDNWVQIAAVITSVIGTASVIVKLTPTPKDDEILGKIKKFIAKFIALN